jgi:hypothetical protein
MLRPLTRLTSLILPIALVACTPGEDDGNADDGTAETGDTGTPAGDPCPPTAATLDESACTALPSDYVPGADDAYAACISDGGSYETLAGTPGAAARIEAFEQIIDLLWTDTAPTKEDFIAARMQYEIDEGLSSRVDRREDLHYPEIPMAEWDMSVEDDKQCTVTELAEMYPDRCIGPSKLKPAINQAFIDGIEGNGDPNVNAAIIKANLVWFIALSSYKEAYSCFQIAGEDCDASWGYFTGGAQIDGALLGLSRMVNGYSPNAAERVFDGILAVRCVRDLYPEDMYPANPVDPLPPDGAALFDTAWEQLDQALFRGVAVVLRQHVASQDSCGDTATANWTFVQILGGYLSHEAAMRDSAASAELDGIYAMDTPTPDDVARAIELIDQVFPCP